MIGINELHIETIYRFDLGHYVIIGRYVSRNNNLLMLENAFVYLDGNKNRFTCEEFMIIDATALKDISIDDGSERKDNSEYYSAYDYSDL